jgi:hypothetical protein
VARREYRTVPTEADRKVVLVLAVLAGLLAGEARAWCQGHPLSPPALRRLWLVPIAFLPQWFAFNLAAGQDLIPDRLAALILVVSQLLLLVFAWCNRDRPGFWALIVGLGLNLLVISLNGGFMPITPETLKQLYPSLPPGWEVGGRLGGSKSILLPAAATHLLWLSDRFLLPSWSPHRVAFSLGDACIAAGAFWVLWASAGSGERLAGAIPDGGRPEHPRGGEPALEPCSVRYLAGIFHGGNTQPE